METAEAGPQPQRKLVMVWRGELGMFRVCVTRV
jgi:hypothetical protein